MPLIDITKPEVIKFLIESYEKTDRLRMRWNNLFQQKLQQTSEFRTDPKGYFEIDVLEKEMIAGMLATTRDHISSKRNRRLKLKTDVDQVLGISYLKKGHTIPEVGLGDPKDDPRLERPDDDFSEDPIMRPVDPEQNAILHKGIPEFGRERYLKVRSKADPEKKYYFPECDSWQYGWRLTDSYFGKQQPMYGRCFRLTRDTMSNSGPQPDPDHYNVPM
ncbi:uncharacterized protein LOC113234838 [Hyposmocoma kahamanoa]|uniref:uncharacterized protein LOC113234838 n=1 Tax=Hyposmocoma kahamanoa TaxID=1477025 RepID=UPI000E6D6703|nr:uncharacterized protein LOC113234838 [Hyposmocoma kahamanoa]